MRQFCSKCEKWFNTEKRSCPKCGAALRSEEECERFDNNISRYPQSKATPTTALHTPEPADADSIEKLNAPEEDVLSVLLSINKSIKSISRNVDFITTLVIIDLVLGGIYVFGAICSAFST